MIDKLDALARTNEMLGKGFLGLALVIVDKARINGLPLDPAAMMTSGGGQVKGAGGARVQAILKHHGINRRLSSEGGRTSRGTPAKMQALVGFLNKHQADDDFSLDAVMAYWIARVEDYFASQPLTLDLDPALGVGGALRRLMASIEVRQRETSGSTLVGTVVQHLIGAKIEIVLGSECGEIAAHGASANDVTGRGGDLEIGDTVIHVTTAPSQLMIEKCAKNLAAGFRPIIVTGRERIAVAEALVVDNELSGRIDVLDYEQFLAANVFELGRFKADGRRTAFGLIIERYNAIVSAVESDPGLRIELR